MEIMPDPLIPPSFLCRYAIPCLYHPLEWTAKGLALGEEHRLLSFAEMDNQRQFADLRMAWSEQGLGFCVRLGGKRQLPWCREAAFDESDGLHVWIDTRDTHNIHRAGRFCHRFAFLPTGGGMRRDEPLAGQLLINRAKEHPKPAAARHLLVRSEKRVDGYVLEGVILAGALTGYDPADHPRLGFSYRIFDREQGEQTLSVGSEMPIEDDPSLWGTVELVR
jgi:hypothetical protein